MIWVLLEITLPLCLAFIAGLSAGWLFWRWRRRSISQTEWNNHGKLSAADELRFSALQEESDSHRLRAEQLQSELQNQPHEQSDEQDANAKQFEEYRQQALAREKQDANKIQELEFRSTNLLSTVDSQSNELKETKRIIKRLREELQSTTDKPTVTKTNVDAEDLQSLQEKNSLLTKEKAQTEQELQQVSKEAALQKNTAAELKAHSETLESTITRQADELLATNKRLQENLSAVESLKTQLQSQQTNQSASDNEELRTLKNKLDTQAVEKSEIEKKLEAVSNEADRNQSLLKDLERSKDALENKLKMQSSERQQSDDKHIQISNDLKSAQEKLVAAKSESAQLEKQLQAKSADAERQTHSYNELQQKLKQAETVTTERDSAIAKIMQLEEQLSAVSENAREGDQSNSQLETLNQKFRNFKASTMAVREAKEEEIATLSTRVAQLLATLEQERERSSDSTTDKQNLQQLEKQLHNARARNNQLAAQIENISPSSQVTPISVAQINKLKTTVEEREQRIKALEEKLKAKKRKSRSTNKKLSWQSGKTKIGTPGCDHKDDLTAISGIGPKIEKVLNQMGIKSWEQLATLKTSEIKLVDQKLVDFSGRITRDEWVDQAKAIMRNGHEPLGKKSKNAAGKPRKAKAAKNSWQKGQTKFGTPGSAHRDDLQVINGVGPVIEKSLNKHGIKSWEQLATLKAKEVKAIDEALDFPGRISREQWVAQAKALVKQFPQHTTRPTRRTFLNKAAAGR